MLDQTSQTPFVIKVSEELRHLRRTGQWLVAPSDSRPRTLQPDSAPVTDHSVDVVTQVVSPSSLHSGIGVAPVMSVLRLRRDGRRPLVFRGTTVFKAVSHQTLPDPSSRQPRPLVASQGFAIYLTETGQVVASASMELPTEAAARPVHRAALVTCAGDLHRFLHDCRPEHLFEADHRPPAEDADRRRWIGSTLRSEFERLTARCRA